LEEVIRRRVAELPDRQREVLVLHVYQGLDYRAIAAALDCSYDDVKVNLSLARRRLREELRERLE
jgi:RNA polymerase sigma factor (sigma-70 family)